jgi:TetR/AcrR family transcriptional repressor of nem operon
LSKSVSKRRIIDSAQELFHRQGFQQTSLDDITRQSGVTKSNLYYHFNSKEELGLETLRERISHYEAEVLEPTLRNTSLTPAERLSEFYKRVNSYHRGQTPPKGCPFGNLAVEMCGTNDNFRQALSAFFEGWQSAIESCIGEGIESGAFRGDFSPRLMAQMILSHLEGAIMMVKTHRTIEPLDSGTEMIMKLLKAA